MAKRTGAALKGKLTKSGRVVRKKSNAGSGAKRRNVLRTLRQFPSVGRMTRVLSFGRKSSPSCLVVMLHGLNDSAVSCAKGVAERWAKGLTGSLVLVPQSPDRTFFSDASNPGYDWLRQSGAQNTSNHEANVRELQRVTRIRARHVECWLRAVMKKHGVGAERLVLTGFSQGSILAAICATRLNALGAVVCGGVTGQPVYSAKENDYVGGGWMCWEDLLPQRKGQRRTRFCAVNGTLDGYVPRRELEAMLSPFECFWHWDHGVGHDFPDTWYKIALDWMKELVGH